MNHYAALSIVAASKSSSLISSGKSSEHAKKRKPSTQTNWVHSQLHKLISGSKETNVKFFLGQLLVRMKEIEKRGVDLIGED